MSETFEFDVTVRVRKRLWVKGPKDREAARMCVKSMIEVGMIGTLAKHGETGKPIEVLMDNDFTVEDATE